MGLHTKQKTKQKNWQPFSGKWQMTFSLDDRVGAVEASEVLVVVVAAEGDGHLSADGGVSDCGQGCGIAAVDPALFEVPQG